MREAFVVANWGWPQWTYIVLVAIGLGTSLANDGKLIEKASAGVTAFSSFILFLILGAGGFFDEIHWPQVVFVILYLVGLRSELSDGGDYAVESFGMTLIADAIVVALFAAGGFFR